VLLAEIGLQHGVGGEQDLFRLLETSELRQAGRIEASGVSQRPVIGVIESLVGVSDFLEEDEAGGKAFRLLLGETSSRGFRMGRRGN